MIKPKILAILSFFICTVSSAQVWEQHWIDSNYVFTGSGGESLTVTQTDCEEGLVQVSDPVNAPLGAFSPAIINPQGGDGSDVVDISGSPVSITLRVRSLEAVEIGGLFRSGDGSSDFRTDILYADVPAGLEAWTAITLDFTDALGGFDATDLRDVWLFLDRGEENFSGNELYIDYVSLGGTPIPGLESPCTLDGGAGAFWEQHWIDSNYVFTGSGGEALTVTQTDCEEGLVQVSDPVNAPLGAFSPVIINPQGGDGSDVVDISGSPVSITLRVRSLEAVEIGGLFRSGDGSSDFRTDILYADVPAGLEAWTAITLDFTDALGGFDATDLRDVWLFLDRGEENFSGNELYIDYVSLGGAPMPGLESPCTLDGGAGAFWEQHWIDSNYVFTGSGGEALTVMQTDCEEGLVQVSDPVNAPLGAFSPAIINPQGGDGSDMVDISGSPVSITLRVRSLEAVEIGGLFRSGDGSSDFRTDILYADVPAGLEAWTAITLDFTDALGGFDATDLRDVWLFLDRGEENFSGNELYIDYVSLGGAPMPGLESPCDLQPGNPGVFVDYFEGDSLTSINTSSIAGQVTDFILDTLCETLLLRVTDPVNSPLPPFNAYQVDPVDSLGNAITDLSAGVNVTMRVRSAEAVAIDVLFRSGEGSSSERSDRKAFTVPAGLETWTNFTLTFEESDYAGFDPTDLRDMWVYLDRGTENFSGNELYIDHITIGTLPDSTRQTPCSTVVEPQTWAAHWEEGETVTLGGSETEKLNVSVTDCGEVFIEVADPVNAAHQAFRPIVINPADENGVEITNITGNVQVVVRARSAEPMPLGVQLRSGDGSADFRTALLTQNIEGRLDGFTVLTYAFDAEDLGGFVADDFLDLWLFLDRENENFPGNELYLDYVAIGPQPDTTLNSPCGLPDIIVSTAEALPLEKLTVFPNPVEHILYWEWEGRINQAAAVRLMNSQGQVVRSAEDQSLQSGRLSMQGLPGGVYYLVVNAGMHQVIRKIAKR